MANKFIISYLNKLEGEYGEDFAWAVRFTVYTAHLHNLIGPDCVALAIDIHTDLLSSFCSSHEIEIPEVLKHADNIKNLMEC